MGCDLSVFPGGVVTVVGVVGVFVPPTVAGLSVVVSVMHYKHAV